MSDDSIPPTVNPLPPRAQGLIARVQALLLRPAETWDVIAGEPASVQSLYMGYVIPLAAIGPICYAIGSVLFGYSIGWGFFGVTVHASLVGALIHAIINFILTLVMVYVVGFIIDALAPSFDGQKNLLNAFKIAAYGMTAAWVAAVFGLLPSLAPLAALIGGLYSIYLIYLGLPKLMKNPLEKTIVYMVVIAVVGAIAGVVVGAVSRAADGAAGMGGYHASAFGANPADNTTFTVNGPNGKASVNLGQMAAAASAMEAQASAIQNSTAAPVKLADASALQALMPQSYMGAAISDTSTESGGAGAISASTATGHYTIGDGSIELKISDIGTMSGLGGFVNAMNINASSSSGSSYSKTTTDGNRMTTEEYDSQAKSGQYTIVLNGRITVEADGNGVDINAIKGLVNSIDINKAMSLTQ